MVLATYIKLLHSFCLCCGRRCILVSINLKAAILCSYGWLDVKCIIVFVVVGFLYISISVFVLVLCMRRSKKFMVPLVSSVWLNVELLSMVFVFFYCLFATHLRGLASSFLRFRDHTQ
jgi:hypothetical protein